MNPNHWSHDAIFYHIYPLGLCGAPPRNDFAAPITPRLSQIAGWIDHIALLGANAVYLGPVFESTAHGYDTADYFQVDRRLGDNVDLADLIAAFHQRDIRVILDGVFNHVGRDFWAFRDVLQRGQASAYAGWFYNLRFDRRSPYKDPFHYEGWNGHFDLVKLNLHNQGVVAHLLEAVTYWISELDIDGLRLDAADAVELGFLRSLAAHCRVLQPDFWLVGEVVHGDYRGWANPETLDSTTNYECYKGLYSSLNDRNYFEIAYALNRQFGEDGIYRDLPLYNFADNHDVDRVASRLRDPALLFPLYCLLFTMPGVPSIYYGSEWGLTGVKAPHSDAPLRPQLDLAAAHSWGSQPELPAVITRLAHLRRASGALRRGSYRQILVQPEQFAFARETNEEGVIVALNAADEPAALTLPADGHELVDLLNPPESISIENGRAKVQIPPYWARVLSIR